jgi:mycothiol synthase
MADAAEVQALIAASDVDEFGEADGYTVEELVADWEGLDLGRDVWVVESPSGTIAGYAYVWPRQHVRIDVEVYIHPEHYGQGIGTTLVRLAETRAREEAPLAPDGAQVALNNWINARNADARRLLEREGYHPVRYFWRMETALDGEAALPRWTEGFDVENAEGDGQLPRIFATFDEAMGDHWGHVHVSYDEWIERSVGPLHDPRLWFLAVHNDEPAGVALCTLSEGVGWVNTLAVRPMYRQRGLGLALLLYAFAELRSRGATRVRLSVDSESPTGATRLYERAGMRVFQEHAVYRKVLRDGAEPAPGS